MITKLGHFGLKIGALAAALALASPALAQNHGGGGGGGHFGGGGGSHASGGHSYSGGHVGGVGHGSAGFSGGHGYAGASHFAPGAHYGYGGGYGHGGSWGGGWHGGWGGGWHGGWGGGWHGTYWGGGYWGGGFWPRAYYGLGFSWFLPVLPLAYATYWYDGVPFYYANSVYYTWNPTYDGYVATDPPPVNDGAGAPPAASDGSAAAPMPQPSGPQGGDQIFMYPRNGQSDAQLATDRGECQQWAASQAGNGGRPDDYRRAMTACAEARGYSAK
jgi:hypothetical protein